MKPAPKLSLAEIADSVQYGYTASADDTEIGPKFLRITDIVPTQIDWNTVPYCKIDEMKFAKFSLAPGDIVIARTGATVGYAKLIRENEPSVFASYLVRVRINPNKADPGYVGRIVESDVYKRFVLSRIGGSAQPNANAKVLSSFRLPLPERSTQKRITSILSAYDDLIENNRRRIQLLEQATRLLYKEWFVHLRFPGHQHTTITNGVPKGWEKKKLRDIANITMGQSPKSEHYNQEGSGLPFHQGVTNFGYRFPSHRIYCTIENRLAESGDILFSVRAPVGRINITPDKIVIGRGLAAIRSNCEQQNILFYALKNYFFKENMLGGGSIFAAVTKKDLEDVELIQPSNHTARMFIEYTKPIDRQILNLYRSAENLIKARDLLLPRLINGGE